MTERISFTEYKDEFVLRLALLSLGDMSISVAVDAVAKEIDAVAPRSWSREAVKDLLRIGAVTGGDTLSDQHVEITGYGYELADRYANKLGMDLTEEIAELEREKPAVARPIPAFANNSFAGTAFAVDRLNPDFLTLENGDFLTDSDGNRLVLGPWDVQSTTITASLKAKPEDIATMAVAIARTVELEIERLQSSKPNDPESLEAWQNNHDFLVAVSSALLELDEGLRTYVSDDSKAEILEDSVSIVKRLHNAFANWLNTNGKDLIDTTVRISVIGLGTAFLGICGAPLEGAFVVTSALMGGPKVANVISDMIKGDASK